MKPTQTKGTLEIPDWNETTNYSESEMPSEDIKVVRICESNYLFHEEIRDILNEAWLLTLNTPSSPANDQCFIFNCTKLFNLTFSESIFVTDMHYTYSNAE